MNQRKHRGIQQGDRCTDDDCWCNDYLLARQPTPEPETARHTTEGHGPTKGVLPAKVRPSFESAPPPPADEDGERFRWLLDHGDHAFMQIEGQSFEMHELRVHIDAVRASRPTKCASPE
jgi:hypothetical protein